MSGYCGKCLKHYTRKENWLKHFKSKHIRTGFGYGANLCYNLDENSPRVYEATQELAKERYSACLRAGTNLKRLITDEQDSPSTSKIRKIDDNPDRETDIDHSDDIPNKAPPDTGQSDGSDLQFDDDNNDDNEVLETENDETYEFVDNKYYDDEPQDAPISSKHVIEPSEVSEGNIDRLFSILTSMQQTQESNHTQLMQKIDSKNCNCSVQKISKPSSVNDIPKANMAIEADESFILLMLSLKRATSMKSIMDNPLIKDNFSLIELDQEKNPNHPYELCCIGCSDKTLRGIQGGKMRTSTFGVNDPNADFTGTNKKMERWFSGLKMSLRRHIEHISHHQYTTSYNLLHAKKYQTTSTIRRLRLNILYYILKTNSPFTLYPILLAVLSRCGMEIGNKNYSRYNVPKILDMLGK